MEVLKMADKMGRKRTGRPRLRKTVTRRDVDYLREHMALANRAAFAVASLISEKPAKQTLTVIRKSARDVVDHGYQACARIDGLLYAMDGQLPPISRTMSRCVWRLRTRSMLTRGISIWFPSERKPGQHSRAS